MLCKKVLAVEVVVVEGVLVVRVDGSGAEVAAPEAKLDVLGADMALPLVLGGEGGLAAVGCEGAGKVAVRVDICVGFHCLACVGYGAAATSFADAMCRWWGCRGRLAGVVGATALSLAARAARWCWGSPPSARFGGVLSIRRLFFAYFHRLHWLAIPYGVSDVGVMILFVDYRSSFRLDGLLLTHDFSLEQHCFGIIVDGLGFGLVVVLDVA
jgi:hypothetical protein